MSLEIRDPSPYSTLVGRSASVVAVDSIENAIDMWAEASTRAETRDREDRLRDKKQIIRSFLIFIGKHSGEVGPTDVRAWRKHLESLKSENTVYSYLSRLSSLDQVTERFAAEQTAVEHYQAGRSYPSEG